MTEPEDFWQENDARNSTDGVRCHAFLRELSSRRVEYRRSAYWCGFVLGNAESVWSDTVTGKSG